MSDAASPPEPTGKRIPLPRVLDAVVAAMAALAAVLSTAANFVDQLRPFQEWIPGPLHWPMLAFLLIATLLLTRRAWRRATASVSIHAHVRDDIETQEDLKGRRRETEHLIRACRESRIVWLLGESGVGKSTLVRAGLCAGLRADDDLIVVHLNLASSWEDGPREALRRAAWDALTSKEREALELGNARPRDLCKLVRAIGSRLSKTLLVVFDQLDGYYAEHLDRFLQDGRSRTAAEITAQSAFWRDIATLLDDGDLRCVFVARSDSTAVFRSLGFATAHALGPITITRLRKDDARDAAEVLVAHKGDIRGEDASAQWALLKERIVRDLAEAGGGDVIPSELRIALDGLLRLPCLTLREYEKAGGLRGFETQYFEDEIAHACNAADVAPSTALAILGQMLDETPSLQSKAAPRTVDELWENQDKQGQSGLSKETISTLLARLADAGIVRCLLSDGCDRWTLYHDYVGRPLREARRPTRRHQARLQKGAENLRLAARASARWRALLSPIEQIVILWARLRSIRSSGGLRYKPYRAYAVWSTLKIAPYALALAVASAGTLAVVRGRAEVERNRSIQSFVDRLSYLMPDFLDQPQTMIALSDFARADRLVQLAFFDRVLSSAKLARHLNSGLPQIVHAAVGTDPAQRAALEGHFFERCKHVPRPAIAIRRACLVLLDSFEPRRADVVSLLVTMGVEVPLMNGSDSRMLRDHLESLRRFNAFDNLAPDEVRRVSDLALRELAKTSSMAMAHQIVATLVQLPAPIGDAELGLAASMIGNSGESLVWDERTAWRKAQCILATRYTSADLDESLMVAAMTRTGKNPTVQLEDAFPEAYRVNADGARNLLVRMTEATCSMADGPDRTAAANGLRHIIESTKRLEVSLERDDAMMDDLRQDLDRCAPWEAFRLDDFAGSFRRQAMSKHARIASRYGEQFARAADKIDEIDLAFADAIQWSEHPDAARQGKEAASALVRALGDDPVAAALLLRQHAEDSWFKTLKLDPNDPDQRWLEGLRAIAYDIRWPSLQDLIDAAGAGDFISQNELDSVNEIEPARAPTAQQLATSVRALGRGEESGVRSLALLLRHAEVQDRTDTVLQLTDIAASSRTSPELAIYAGASIRGGWRPDVALPTSPAAYRAFQQVLQAALRLPAMRAAEDAIQTFVSMVPAQKRHEVTRDIVQAMRATFNPVTAARLRKTLLVIRDAASENDVAQLFAQPGCIGSCRDDLAKVLRATLVPEAPGEKEGFWPLLEFAAKAGVHIDGFPRFSR